MTTDRYGRIIVIDDTHTFSVPGITVEAADLDAALVTFNAMAPTGWHESQVGPLSPVGALATLLAVVEVLTVEDAANAVQLTPADLIAEAEAWAAASAP